MSNKMENPMAEHEQKTNFELILQSLDQVNDRQAAQELQLTDISKTLNELALQKKDINVLTGRVDAVWDKMDFLLDVDGIIPKIKSHQDSCPRDSLLKDMDLLKIDIKESLFFHVKLIWGAIGALLVLMGVFKLFG